MTRDRIASALAVRSRRTGNWHAPHSRGPLVGAMQGGRSASHARPIQPWVSRLSVSLWLTLACFASVTHAQLNWDGGISNEGSVIDSAPSFDSRPTGNGSRRIRVFPRSSVPWRAESFETADGSERVAVIDSGVNIIVDRLAGFGTVDISTDRIVIWASAQQRAELESGNATTDDDAPLEFYLEGNIVFRQGDRVVYANRMYYNVREEAGVVLDGELLTPVEGYQGLVRLKANILRQVSPSRIEGFDGALTTSRLGIPRYWLQSSDFVYETMPNPLAGTLDTNGRPYPMLTKRVTSEGNRLFLAEWPIFYWPRISANLDRPTFVLESLSVNRDSVFGTQVLSDWNLYQALGFRSPPSGTRWTGSLDYLSERGFGVGSYFEYDRFGFWGRPGPTRGFLDIWGINDDGLDNLGLGRRQLAPEKDFRGRILGRHRQQLDGGYEVTGEIGVISDRNFLEQYYEEEWDQEKDQTTGLQLKRRMGNQSWSVGADLRVNDFFTQTNWLPRLDHFWIRQPILGDWITWTEHSNIGYAKLEVADAPDDPGEAALFDPLAWEADREGIRATTRQRIDLPLQWRGAKIVPYALGEATYWHEDLSGDDQSRVLGQLGVRSSIPIVRVDPSINSVLFNVNGLAHKVVFESEFFWADSDTRMTDLPLYDPLDDDSVEFFRRRFFFQSFGGVAGDDIALRFDERFYALRSGMQRWVTAPSREIADDLTVLRLAARQRWQTKRGAPGRQRVVDWITLDLEGSLFPDADRDNFGQEAGLVNYEFRWHVGDRFTVLSDGMADFFADGLRTFSLGGMVSRPGRGRYVVGVRNIEGPISSSILYGSTSYRVSPKWIVNYASTFDLGETGNIGQRGQIIRVGESFLVGVGFNYDNSRDNFGVRFSIEPRFLSGKLSRVGGVPIPPVGFNGLE